MTETDVGLDSVQRQIVAVVQVKIIIEVRTALQPTSNVAFNTPRVRQNDLRRKSVGGRAQKTVD